VFALLVMGAICQGAALFAAEPRVIELWPEGVPDLKPDAGPEKEDNGRFTNIHHPSLTLYAPAIGKANGTAVIYAAGGGYVRVAIGANGGEITRWLNSLGITVFVLKYRHADYGHPAPLRDAIRAVRTVRSRAAEFGVKSDRVGMLGGSAGGHLTASAGTLFDAPEGRTGSELDRVSGRPDFMVLVFPVITMQDPYAHGASRRGLLGPNPSDELKLRLSVDQQVTKDTPPTFLVHSSEDTTVVVENSLLFYQAMRRAKAPIEMHLYPKGPHGSGMSPSLGPTSEWPRLCELWMRFNGWLPAKSAAP
jgi:acetyl esterase/lipase